MKKQQQPAKSKQVAGAPVARQQSRRQRGPSMKASGDGSLMLKHSEVVRVVRARDDPYTESFRITPSAPELLGQIARGFQEYKFTKLAFRYVPRQGTTASGTVSFGIVYSNEIPTAGLLSGQANWSGLARYVKELVGSVSVPPGGALDLPGNVAKAIVDRFTRKLYHMAMPFAVTNSPRLDSKGGDPSQTPGYFMFAVEPGSVTAGEVLGDIYMDYEIKLISPTIAKGPSSMLQLVSDSTDDAALALHQPLLASGDFGDFRCTGNEIHFEHSGVYDVEVIHIGSSLNSNQGSLTVSDVEGSAVTDEALGSKYAIDTSSFENMGAAGTTDYVLESTTKCWYKVRIHVESGHYVTIPSLSAGSLTRTLVNIYKVGRVPVISSS